MSNETPARQDREVPPQLEFEQRGLQRGTVHFGAGGEDFKRGRRMTQRIQQPRGIGGKRGAWVWRGLGLGGEERQRLDWRVGGLRSAAMLWP
jgi:hypothetical protein